MRIKFGDFQFDCENNILTQHRQIIHLNEKPACILKLFLQDPNKIHSKTEILDHVWPDRVVTEQVIFQNISYLRAKFGDSSIRTFSRKGYQWQLPVAIVENSSVQQIHNSSDKTDSRVANTHTNTNNKLKLNRYLALSCSIALLAIIWFAVTKSILSPETSSKISVVKLIEQSDKTSLNVAPYEKLNAQDLFDAPYSAWQSHATSESQWLVATKIYELEDGVALRFHIQGANRGWHDYLWADNATQAIDKFNALSVVLSSTNYFAAKTTHEALAELIVIAQQLPDKSLLNQQIIKLNYELENLDRANLLAGEALATSAEKLHQGLTYLLKAEINLWNQNDKIAEQSLVQGLAIFRQLNLTHLEAQALIKQSWVHLSRQEFRHGINLLNQAASKARAANEPLLEFEAHISQSFMASKIGQTELSHAKMGLAKELYALHKLDDIHKVRIHNNVSWMAETQKDKVSANENILALPFSPQYEKLFYAAVGVLRAHYTAQKNLEKVEDLIKPWQRLSFQSLTKSHIAFAKEDWKHGIEEAQTAFQFASINHHRVDALDAALLLLQHQVHDERLGFAQYRKFINQYATKRWLSQNSNAIQLLPKGEHN